MGAWIETYDTIDEDVDNKSHPIWVRGLKHCLIRTCSHSQQVAPYMGAWIETTPSVSALSLATSHPIWVRGLKHSMAFC